MPYITNMSKIKTIAAATALAATTATAQAGLVAHFPMEVSGDRIEETVSGQRFYVEGHFAPENVAGAVGHALRFDGYTSHVDAYLGDIIPAGTQKMTVSMWVAVPCYPIIQIDTNTGEKTAVVSCLDTDARTGFGLYLGFNGKYSFRTYLGGWPVNIDVDEPLPTYRWNNITAVIDCDAQSIRLYNNGEKVGSARASGSVSFKASALYMGQGRESRMAGPFQLMSFNGLIDDISIWDEAKDQATIKSWQTTSTPDLDIPASRFADDILRPRFHGMPAAGWTNECHGMWHSDGRYHLFFQKNADGPYMARLHWGHISSENLYDWREEKIALAPGNPYDIKGCWSGCVFADEAITGGKPNILYTAVDYARATIAQAEPTDASLDNWIKAADNPIIDWRPGGLSDDFRDPYFFRNGDNAYIIVGTAKGGIGATTLHRYDAASGKWSNNGDIFFSGSNAAQDGTFWEMPNITQMPDGRWLFTATPMGTGRGVRTLYWTGSIAADGTFVPDANSATPRTVEMESREGFGLLSPTIYRHNDKTIATGIVPDKLPSADNWNLGWAHCYSLPREWRLDADGTLLQKPYEGLAGLRTEMSCSRSNIKLDGELPLDPVRGRALELCATFEAGNSAFGFQIFKSAAAEGTISYNPATGELTADFSRLTRLVNDGGVYDGVYRCTLPERIPAGAQVKLDVWVDHSIVDIFVNDKWATSVRIFATDAQADGTAVFADGPTTVGELNAWVLKDPRPGSGIGDAIADGKETDGAFVDVYDIAGVKIRSGVARDEATVGLPAGIYIAGGRKVAVR